MANKIYSVIETAITFKASGGTVLFTATSLANVAGRYSTQWDRTGGAVSKPDRYLWHARTKIAVAPAVGTILTIYLGASDGTDNDGELGTTDAALPAADRRRNLTPIGVIVADEASTSRVMKSSGIVELTARYYTLAWYNEFGQALSATAGDHVFTLEPVPPEIQ